MTNNTPDKPQKLKKSETLEVRIPYETKQAFLTACREHGTTASEVVRESVQTYLDERERPVQQPERTAEMTNILQFTAKLPPVVRRYGPRVAASGVAALALATFAALPSAAAPDFQAAFRKLDANGDGVITAEEFAGKTGAKDDDVRIETRIIRSGDGKDAPKVVTAKPVEMKQEAFAFWLPDELTSGDAAQQHEYRFATASEIRIDKKDGDADPAVPQITIVTADDMRRHEFEGFDTDKDGKVSFAEFQARQKAMLTRGFEMLDANSDKSLSRDEYDRIGTPPMPKIEGLDDKDGRQIHFVTAGPKYSAEKLNAAFEKLDANKDKKLSLQEYLPPA
jgi:Ca2+-binding EF-hand superfamily protein/antitoxin component of RelBE/YafQ-DinJ toxin-antitoxin module